MRIINYLHKVQGIDKVVPLLFVLKRLEPQLSVHTVMDVEQTALNAVPYDLLSSLQHLSDTYTDAPKHSVYSFLRRHERLIPGRLFRFLERLLGPTFRTFFQDAGDAFEQEDLVLLCINSARSRSMGRLLGRYVKAQGGLVLTYLKSVNDRGRGLSVVGKAKADAGAGFHDILLIPNRQIYVMLVHSGYPDDKLLVAGYPPFYQAWRRHVVAQAAAALPAMEGKRLFVVFARGPAPHKPDKEQIITAEMEVRLLTDIVSVVHEGWPDAWVWIKPHPYQETAFLQRLAREHPRVEIRHESVQRLSALADVAISTYSSASLDALAYGKPSIEYFEETANFLAAHPGGSTFGECGVVICRSRPELHGALETAVASSDEERSRLVKSVLEKFSHDENATHVLETVHDRLRSWS